MLLNQDNQTILTPPLSNKNNEMSKLQDVKMDIIDNGDSTKNFNNMTFLQEQGEGDDISLLYNEIFQNPMEIQNQGLMNLDEGSAADLNDAFIPPMTTEEIKKLSAVNNALPLNTTTDASVASNAFLSQSLLAGKAKGSNLTAASSSLLDPKLKAFPTASTTAAAAHNNIKNSIPSPMVQTPFLHPMFSTPTFSYLNDSAVTTNGVTSPLFEFTPPSTPPHTHTNGASKLKNIYKPTVADAAAAASIVENSPLLCSDVFAIPTAINKQIATTALEDSANSALAFSPALNLPMKKLALFSPNVEEAAVSDIYPSSFNYLDDTMVNSPLLPVNEEVTTSSLLPLYNTGMYDVHSPFLMEKPDEGYDPNMSVAEASLMYDQISPNISTAASTPGLLDTNTTNELLLKEMVQTDPNVLNEVSPILSSLNQTSPFLAEQGNLSINQSPFLPEQASLGSSPYLPDRTSLANSPFISGEQGQVGQVGQVGRVALGKSPFVDDVSEYIGEQASLVNSPFVGEAPIITLNDSPCLPEQASRPLRNKTVSPSSLLIDPRYTAAYTKGTLSPVNPAYLLNKKRKMGIMDYTYGPLAKIQRIQGKERNSLEEVSSGFIKRDDTCVKPSPLLQEININDDPVDDVEAMDYMETIDPLVNPYTASSTIKSSDFLTLNSKAKPASTILKSSDYLSVNGNPKIPASTLKSTDYLTVNGNPKSNLSLNLAASASKIGALNPNDSRNSTLVVPSSTQMKTTAAAKTSGLASTKNLAKMNSLTSPATLATSKLNLSKIDTTSTKGTENLVKVNPKSSSTTTTTTITTPKTTTTTKTKTTTNTNTTTTTNTNATTTASADSTKMLNKSPILPIALMPEFKGADPNFIKNYTMYVTSKNAPSLVSMAGIKLDTKKTKDDLKKKKDNTTTTSSSSTEKISKTVNKVTKNPGKKGRRSKKATTENDATPSTSNISDIKSPGGEVSKMKFDIDSEETALMNGITNTSPNNKFLMPNAVSVNPTEEMDYNDIPTIKLGNTPNLDMLSPASSSLGMTTPNLNSPLLQPLSFNFNSNMQLFKKLAKKKYPCTYPGCTKSFSRPCHRQSHERSHQNSRPFVCPECQRAFCRKHDMIRHQRIHSKERPYQCKICKRKFARGDALVRHRTRPTSSCFQADMALAKKIRQQQHRLIQQQQQQIEYERLQKEKQMKEATAAATTNGTNDSNVGNATKNNNNTVKDIVMTTPSVATATTSTSNSAPAAAVAAEK